jgi:2-dehydropantoate 2-reductase
MPEQASSMKVAVLGGGGAMGGLFGGYLARAGVEVVLIDVSEQAVTAINGSGLKISEKDGSVTRIKALASRSPASLGKADFIINFVKCYHTEDAVRAAMPMVGPKTAFLSLQNGWGNAERIASIAGRDRVMVGLTYHSATLLEPGHLAHPGTGMTYVGELDGKISPRLGEVTSFLAKAGFEVTQSPHILTEIWKKLALNVCTLPTSALMRFFAHQLIQHDGMLQLMKGLLKEVVTVARAEGIELDETERWNAITGLLQKAVGAKASMLQDVEARRRTEIDVINGAIVAAGARHRIATPLNDAMVWLVTSLQDSYSTQT